MGFYDTSHLAKGTCDAYINVVDRWMVVSVSRRQSERREELRGATRNSGCGDRSVLLPDPSLEQAYDTDIRSRTKPGRRCEEPTPAGPLDPACFHQEALVRQKPAVAFSQRSPTDLPIIQKG